jgi:hypothetical protein
MFHNQTYGQTIYSYNLWSPQSNKQQLPQHAFYMDSVLANHFTIVSYPCKIALSLSLKHFTAISYGPSKIYCTGHCMHLPNIVKAGMLAYFSTTVSYDRIFLDLKEWANNLESKLMAVAK